jgi:hypothetical protein
MAIYPGIDLHSTDKLVAMQLDYSELKKVESCDNSGIW